jgi:hypothetical protein
MNTSVTTFENFNLTATADFWWYFPALLTDSKRVRGVPPLNCTDKDTSCISYFVPGSMSTINLDPNIPPITKNSYPKATAYIQNNAPGYQVDFKAIDRVNDPSMTFDDCRLYGLPGTAIWLCLKRVENSFLAGTPTIEIVLQKRGMHVLQTLESRAVV